MAADASVTMTDGTAYTFTAADSNFDDQGDGGVLDRVNVVSLPATGTLFLDADEVDDGEALAPGADVAKADLDASRLRLLPDAAAAGFTFKVHAGRSGCSTGPPGGL